MLEVVVDTARHNYKLAIFWRQFNPAWLAEGLFWTVLDHLQKLSPGFATGGRGKGLARRFRRVIHVVDSSTIALVAPASTGAQRRRRKAAANL